MNNLYIIGNGFDLYHDIDTSYLSFAKYLLNDNIDLYELIINTYLLPDISFEPTEPIEYAEWSYFEKALANLDYKRILDDNLEYLANPGAPDFRDRDWNTFQIEMELLIDKLTIELKENFNSFILNLKYPDSIDNLKISFEPKSLFLNFNYTNTLEKFYNINDEYICYIHNRTGDNKSNIILGHGTDPSKFKIEKINPPKGLTEDELNEWREYMSEQENLSYNLAEYEIHSYYTKSFKNTQSIIKSNIDFFKKLNSIKNIYILGHSISSIDIEYFKAVKHYLNSEAQWFPSYHNLEEKDKHLRTLMNIGIDKKYIKQIKIEQLK